MRSFFSCAIAPNTFLREVPLTLSVRGSASTAIGTVTVTVTAVNDVPEPVEDAGTTDEDTPITLAASVLVNNDEPGPTVPLGTLDHEQQQTLTLIGADALSSQGGVVTWSPANGRVTYTPPENFNGQDSFKYHVADNGLTDGFADSQVAVGTVTVTVAAVNDGPQIQGPSGAAANEDVPQPIMGLSVSDVDVHEPPSGGVLWVGLHTDAGTVAVDPVPGVNLQTNGTGSVMIVGTPSQINATFADPNGLRYLGDQNFNGTDTLTVTVTDAGQTGKNDPSSPSEVTHTVTLTVDAVNDAPVVTPVLAQQAVDEDRDMVLTSINITDVDENETAGARLQVVLSALNGTLAANTSITGGLAADGVGGNGTSQVTLSGSLAAINTTLGHPMGVFYAPIADFHGQDTVTVTASDLGHTGPPGPQEGSATVAITVNPANDVPVANDDPSLGDPPFAVDEDAILITAGRSVLGNDADPDGDDLDVVDGDANPGDGTYQVVSTRGAQVDVDVEDGTFTYDPTGVPVFQQLHDGEVLTDTFAYEATDGLATSNVATATVTVTGNNDVPEAIDDQYTAADNALLDTAGAGLAGVLDNDVDAENDPLQVVASDARSELGATITMRMNGDFVYDPTSSSTLQSLQQGDPPLVDRFTYAVDDHDPGTNSTSTGTVTVTVVGVSDAPIAVADAYQTTEGQVLNVAAPGVLWNDTDVDSQQLSVIPQTKITQLGGVVQLFGGGGFSYDPRPSAQLSALTANQTLDDGFTYTVTDNQSGFASTTVTVTVSGVAGPPHQNPRMNTDVNDDGVESPIDALTVINFVNANGPSELPPGTPTPPYLDVNGDGSASALDVLEVVARLNEIAAGLGESESADVAAVPAPLSVADGFGIQLVSLGLSGANDLPSAIDLPSSRVDWPMAVAVPADDSSTGLSDRTDPATATGRSVFEDLPLDRWGLEDALSGLVEQIGHAEAHEAATDEVLGGIFGQ